MDNQAEPYNYNLKPEYRIKSISGSDELTRILYRYGTRQITDPEAHAAILRWVEEIVIGSNSIPDNPDAGEFVPDGEIEDIEIRGANELRGQQRRRLRTTD